MPSMATSQVMMDPNTPEESLDVASSRPSVSSRLLDLPAELRSAIYEYALAPGVLCLTSTQNSRRAVQPRVSPALVATCKQIYHETKDLLCTANEVVFSVDAHDTCWPTISESRTPQHVLERLEHICVILDCTANFRASYEDVDFTAFEALTALKSLRVSILYDSSTPVIQIVSLSRGDELVRELLSRVPNSTTVLARLEDESLQMSFANGVLTKRRATRNNPASVHLMPEEEVLALLSTVEGDVRGSKSGGNPDVFAEYHVEPGYERGMGKARVTGAVDFTV